MPISYDATEPEIAYRLARRELQGGRSPPPSAAICSRAASVGARISKTLIVTDRGTARRDGAALRDLVAAPPKSAPRDPASLHETAFILYTSGTTGRAKGVQLTVHGMLWVVAACWAPITGLCERDISNT